MKYCESNVYYVYRFLEFLTFRFRCHNIYGHWDGDDCSSWCCMKTWIVVLPLRLIYAAVRSDVVENFIWEIFNNYSTICHTYNKSLNTSSAFAWLCINIYVISFFMLCCIGKDDDFWCLFVVLVAVKYCWSRLSSLFKLLRISILLL